MSISKTRNYLLLNYCSSPVSVNTRYDSFLIPGGTEDDPGSLPFTLDEIAVINSNTQALRIGLLWPEPDFREEIYEEVRVPNWKDIMSDKEIRSILLNPTLDGLQKILDIENDAYFERIRGIYMGMKNSGVDISNKVATMMEARRQEFSKNQRKTRIVLSQQKSNDAPVETDKDKRIAELEENMRKMRELMEQLMNSKEPELTAQKEDNQTVSTKRSYKQKSVTKKGE